MKKHLRVLWIYTQNSIRISLQQKTGAVMFLIGKLLRFGISTVFIFYLLKNTKLLAGYTMDQTVVFYLTYNVIDSISQQFFREVYRFRPLIVSGDFDTILVKPVHPFTRVLLGGIDILDFLPTIIYLSMLGYFLNKLDMLATPMIVVFAVMIFSSLIITAAFHILVLAVGIVSTEVDHTIMIYRDILRMGTFPIDIYAEPLRSVLTFVVPVGLMMSFPVKALFGYLSTPLIVISLVLAAVFFLLSIWAWNGALARYQSASS
jgi:ABC-2 type transport system permease protein